MTLPLFFVIEKSLQCELQCSKEGWISQFAE